MKVITLRFNLGIKTKLLPSLINYRYFYFIFMDNASVSSGSDILEPQTGFMERSWLFFYYFFELSLNFKSGLFILKHELTMQTANKLIRAWPKEHFGTFTSVAANIKVWSNKENRVADLQFTRILIILSKRNIKRKCHLRKI